MTIHVNRAKAIRLLAHATMRDFTKYDWFGFSGCECEKPQIGEADGYTIVLDGERLLILAENDDFGGQVFAL